MMAASARALAGRFREPVLVVLAGLTLAIVLHWDVVTHLNSHVAVELGDPLLQTWTLAWLGYGITQGRIWDANIFYPAQDSLAFTDTLLGYLPFSFVGSGPEAALARYNLVYLFAFALAFIGCYALARQLGAAWPGAALAGVAFAIAPWRLAHLNHVNILSTGGIALALFALARGYGFSFTDGYRSDRRRTGWIIAGWALAAWQVTLGFALGIAFVYALGAITLIAVVGWWLAGRPPLGRSTLLATVGGMAGFLLVTYLMAQPFLRIMERYDTKRTLAEVQLFSPKPISLITAPEQSAIWGDVHASTRADMFWPSETTLLPGFIVLVFAIIGLFVSSWRRWIRIALGLGAAVSAILALGTGFFGGHVTYLVLWEHAPGFNAIRTPGRLILWTTLCVALLAAGAVTRIGTLLRAAPGRASAVGDGRRVRGSIAFVCLLPALLAVGEGVPRFEVYAPPQPTATVRKVMAEDDGPVLFIPVQFADELRYMLWSTGGFPRIANGTASFDPPTHAEMEALAAEFPSSESIRRLRAYGIRTVVVLRADIVGTPFATVLDAPPRTPGVSWTSHDDAVVFTLEPAPQQRAGR